MQSSSNQLISVMKIYLVGGAVRDQMLNRPVTERDWVVTGARPAMLLNKGYTQVGKDFPVFLHPKTKEEYALARLERKSGQGYTGFVCDAGPSVTLKEDLLRRDLTINAMAQDENGQIIDPFDGQRDLAQKLLRHVSPAFSEDPLRVLRVARFAARYHYLGFTVAEETMTLMREMARSDMLKELTAERVWQETRRALMEQDPAVFFTTLEQADALSDWFAPLTPFDKNFKSILSLSAEQNIALPCRFGALMSYLTYAQVKALTTALKCPNDISALALLAADFADDLIHTTDAEAMLSAFNQCDVWRRPERFALLLQICELKALNDHIDWSTDTIQRPLDAAQNVDVQQIIAQGYKGPEIKTALNQARLKVVSEKLSF